jgi:hypothetical protein
MHCVWNSGETQYLATAASDYCARIWEIPESGEGGKIHPAEATVLKHHGTDRTTVEVMSWNVSTTSFRFRTA